MMQVAPKALEKVSTSDDTFVVAFRQNDLDFPPFYVIGNRSHAETPHMRKCRGVDHDFCIVVPDVRFHNRHYSDPSKRPPKRLRRDVVKDRAVYIRPLQPLNE